MKKTALILILVVMVTLTGCQGKKYFAPVPIPIPDPDPKPSQIEILSHEGKVEWWEYGQKWINEVTGTAKNNSGQTCTPWILVRFYNYNDVMVRESIDMLHDIPSGEVWAFRIVYYGEKIKRYKIWVDRVT